MKPFSHRGIGELKKFPPTFDTAHALYSCALGESVTFGSWPGLDTPGPGQHGKPTDLSSNKTGVAGQSRSRPVGGSRTSQPARGSMNKGINPKKVGMAAMRSLALDSLWTLTLDSPPRFSGSLWTPARSRRFDCERTLPTRTSDLLLCVHRPSGATT